MKDSKKTYRILAIDDRRDVLLLMRMLLTGENHTFQEASTGREGIEKALAFQPEIVFCDIGLPGEVDGLAVAQALRKQPTLKDSYLVALSGLSDPADFRNSQEAGFDFHLIKPIQASVLTSTIANRPTFEDRPGPSS